MLQKYLFSAAIALFSMSAFAAKPITVDDVKKAQSQWADAIVVIGKTKGSDAESKKVALMTIDKLYAYADGGVLFKPTKAAQDQFRETKDQALSYFVGGSNPEDHGFALQPWSKVKFADDEQIIIDSDSAVAMGNYYFTDSTSGKEVKVEFTFGYKRAKDDRLVIFLHHSSLPYQPH